MPRGCSALRLPPSIIALLISSLMLVGGQSGGAPGCGAVPAVPGLDQSPSDRSQFGKCTDAIDAHIKPNSNWCNFGKLGYWPAGPSRQARRCMKFGRMTVYRGPVWGSEPAHKGACNATLVGTNETAMVAVSTKYLKTAQHGWVEDKGSCGKCMCIRLRGVDDVYNTGVNYYSAKQYFGLTFLGQVGDRCGECEDDHIDVLMDTPFSYAPFDPAHPKENQHARFVNSFPGLRGFGNPWIMRGGHSSPESVGTWVSDWQWVPCEGSSHTTCADLMRNMGYKQVWTPQMTVGVNSDDITLAETPLSPPPWTTTQQGDSQAPSQAAPGPAVAVGPLEMCGGTGDGCRKVDSKCVDEAWASCPVNYKCQRQNEWYWGCEPIKV